jgi:hypothetical protein
MERVGMVGLLWIAAPKNDARTTQSPAIRGASPQCAGGRPSQPGNAHSNAYYAAEVQSVLRRKTGWRALGKPGRNNAFPRTFEFLAVNSPLVERNAISLTFFAGLYKVHALVDIEMDGPLGARRFYRVLAGLCRRVMQGCCEERSLRRRARLSEPVSGLTLVQRDAAAPD